MKRQCHIAQINIARARAPIDDPLMLENRGWQRDNAPTL